MAIFAHSMCRVWESLPQRISWKMVLFFIFFMKQAEWAFKRGSLSLPLGRGGSHRKTLLLLKFQSPCPVASWRCFMTSEVIPGCAVQSPRQLTSERPVGWSKMWFLLPLLNCWARVAGRPFFDLSKCVPYAQISVGIKLFSQWVQSRGTEGLLFWPLSL